MHYIKNISDRNFVQVLSCLLVSHGLLRQCTKQKKNTSHCLRDILMCLQGMQLCWSGGQQTDSSCTCTSSRTPLTASSLQLAAKAKPSAAQHAQRSMASKVGHPPNPGPLPAKHPSPTVQDHWRHCMTQPCCAPIHPLLSPAQTQH